jgi:hypothetical protein
MLGSLAAGLLAAWLGMTLAGAWLAGRHP